jgi:thioredoxin-related protein
VKLYNEYREKGFEIISVNVQDTPAEVAQFLHKYGAQFIGAINSSPTDIAELYGVTATPTNVVINQEGQIVAKLVGLDMNRLLGSLRRAGLQ